MSDGLTDDQVAATQAAANASPIYAAMASGKLNSWIYFLRCNVRASNIWYEIIYL